MRSTFRRMLLGLLLLSLLVVVSLVGGRFLLKMREKKSTNSCLGQLRQIGLAMSSYAADHEGRLPNALTWPADLRRQLRNDGVLYCPDDPRGPGRRGYDMLQALSYQPLPEEPGDRILLYEIGDYGLEYRHRKGMHLGFCDGHGKWYPKQVLTPYLILSGLAPKRNP